MVPIYGEWAPMFPLSESNLKYKSLLQCGVNTCETFGPPLHVNPVRYQCFRRHHDFDDNDVQESKLDAKANNARRVINHLVPLERQTGANNRIIENQPDPRCGSQKATPVGR